MGTPVQMPDGTWQTVDNERIPDLVSQGARPPDDVFVSFNGTQSKVPYDTFVRLSARQDNGNLSLVPEATLEGQRHLADLEDTTSAAGSFGRGALQELSFGAYRPSDEQELADSTYHGTARTVGRVAGVAGPLLVPGVGEGKIAQMFGGKAVETVADIARGGRVADEGASLARGASDLLPGRLTAQVAGGVNEALDGGLIGHTAGGLAEGAAQETMRSVLDRDHEFSGEAVLAFGAGAGLGYGVARGATAIGEGLERLGGRLSKATRVDDSALVERLESNRPPTPGQVSEARAGSPFTKDVLGNAANDIPLASANQAVVRDAGGMLGKVRAWERSPFAQIGPEITPFVDRGIASLELIKNFAKLEPTVQARVMGAYEGHLHNVDEMVASLNRTPGHGLDLNTLPTRWRPQNVASRQEALAKLDTSTMTPGEIAARRLGTRLTAGTDRVSAARGVSDGLLSRIPIVGKALSKASEHPIGSLFLLDQVMEHGVLHVAKPIAAAAIVGKAFKAAYKVPARGISLAGDLLSRAGVDHRDLPDDGHLRARAVADRIVRDTPQAASERATQAAGPVGHVSPNTLISVGNTAANRQTALAQRVNEIFPPSGGSLHMAPRPASSQQVRDLDRSIRLSSDPTEFARMLSTGELSKRDLDLSRQVWPAHVRRATSLASDYAASNQGHVPRTIARRLELLLGSDAVGTSHADSGVAAQASIDAAKQRAKPNPSPMPQPNGGHPRSDLMSPAQSAAGRPTD